MDKVEWNPGTMIYPLPAVMVSCGTNEEEFNIITISWTGTICTDPPMCYISVRPERHSYNIIKRAGGYVINLTTASLAKATDWCGVKTGARVKKFHDTGLTPAPAKYVNAPLILESPVNIECKVKEIIELGSHHMFISEVIAIHADARYIEPESGAFRLDKADMICYSHGKYFTLGNIVGKFGFSVKKGKKGKRGN
jgi:flavin reductase (DIM6/NTAB) family NADH-FMN oxidoreductase RutF